MTDLAATDEQLAEALWLIQHEKSELYEQENLITRELVKRAEGRRKIKAGDFEVNVQHRAYVKRDLPDKFLGSDK